MDVKKLLISEEPVRVGVSSCLLGENVRFNGQHARDGYVASVLSQYCQWIPMCPEVGSGMSTPRETVRLTGDPESPRLVGRRSGTDYTDAMSKWIEQAVKGLSGVELHGFILKRKSPSCGIERIPVHGKTGHRIAQRDGLFAAALRKTFPHLPMEEEGRLNDDGLRDHFLRRVYAYKRWQDFIKDVPSLQDLVSFHTAHKYLLMVHSPQHLKELGQLLANAQTEGKTLDDLIKSYGETFMAAISKKARRGRHANVLYKLMHHLKDHISKGDRQEMLHYIERYQEQRISLAVPLTLMSHHLRRQSEDNHRFALYLKPFPEDANLLPGRIPV